MWPCTTAPNASGSTCTATPKRTEVLAATANVSTLWPEEIKMSRRDGLGDFFSEKVARLDREFRDAGYHVVGVQETRIAENLDVTNKHYRVVGSAATQQGNYGVQIWFSRSLDFSLIEVLPISPRILMAVAEINGHLCIISSVHAPINGDPEAAGFYSSFSARARQLQSKYPNAFSLHLTDLNAKVGSVPSRNIGFMNAETENENGEHMRLMLAELNLVAVNTFFNAGPTWTGASGYKHRIDYILVSAWVLNNVSSCTVNGGIELVECERDDHNVVDASLELSSRALPHGTARQHFNKPCSKLCPQKLQDPSLQQRFINHMWSFNISEEISIDEHLGALQDHLRAGKAAFCAERSRPRKQFITDTTWHLMTERSAAKKSMRSGLALVRYAKLSLVFLSWASCAPTLFQKHHRYGELLDADNFVRQAYASWALALKWYDMWRTQVRKALKCDKCDFLENIARRADQAAEFGDNKAIWDLCRQALCEKANVVKTVERLDGTLTTSADEYSIRMQEHFADVFGAAVVDNLGALKLKQPDAPHPNPSECPSAPEVAEAIRRQPLRKACGDDDIPIELIRVGEDACASKIWELLTKVWQYAYWPASWRGGRLRELHKKESVKKCDNYRGLLINDHMGKVGATLLHDRVDDEYHAYVPEAQCGAVKLKGSDFATHLLRTMLDYAAANALSIAILFVDLVKAFDHVLREVVIGWPQLGTTQGVEYLKQLGFNEKHAEELAAEIAMEGCVFDLIRVHPHVKDLVASMHTKSWFRVAGRSELLVVNKGGRQGCKFGGVVFNLLYAKALKSFSDKLNREHIPVVLEFSKGCPPGVCPAQRGGEVAGAIILDVTFVDDEAVVVTASVPATMASRFRRVVEILTQVFEHYGMTINWKPGKTEVIAVFRGTGAVAERQRLICDNGKRKFRVQQTCGEAADVATDHVEPPKSTGQTGRTIDVNAVDRYKHLGSIVDGTRSLVPEARNRVDASMNSFGPLSMRILGNKSINIKRRVALGWSLVVSRLTFNVHVWSSFEGKPRSIVNNMYMRLWRRIAGDPKFARTTWTDLQVRRWLDVPSIDCHLRRKRLKYFSRLARLDFAALHAALQVTTRSGEQLPRVQLIIKDLCILREALPIVFAEMPPPEVDLTPYWSAARDCPAEWAAILRRYKSHEDDEGVVGCTAAQTVLLPSLCKHQCRLCGQRFCSEARLGRHMYAKHKIKSSVRHYVGDISECPVCGTDFQTRNRLIMHLMKGSAKSKHRQDSCRVSFMKSRPSEVEPHLLRRLEAIDFESNKLARKHGHNQELAVRPYQRTRPPIHKGKSLQQPSASRRFKRCVSDIAPGQSRTERAVKRLRT